MRHLSARRHAALVLPPCCAVAGLVAFWWLLITIAELPAFILPAPGQVLATMWEDRTVLLSDTIATLSAALAGLAIAVLCALLVAMVMDLWPLALRTWYPLIVLSQTIQILAIAPLIIIWFGFGLRATLIIVVLFCFFPITIALVTGLRNTPAEYLLQFRAMRATRWQTWKYCRLPAALPAFFGGVRVAAAYAVISATIGEWVGSSSGLGVYILRSKNALQTAQVFGGMLLCSLLSILLFVAIIAIERLLLARYARGRTAEQRWHTGTEIYLNTIFKRGAI